MSNDIFRQEALAHASEKWLGRALLIPAIPLWIVGTFAAVLVTALVLLLAFGTYTGRINVVGEVTTQPHAVNMYAPERGYITEVCVKLGQHVERDTPLYRLNVSRVTSSGNVSQQMITAIKDQIAETDRIIASMRENKQHTIDNIRDQITRYEQIYRETQQITAGARTGMNEAREDRARYEDYFKRGLIARDQSISQQSRFYQQASQYQSLSSQSMQQRLQVGNLQSDIIIKAADFDNQIAQQMSQRSNLTRQLAEAEATGQILITAPTEGIIDSLSVTPGQMVNVGDSLLQISPRHVDAYRLVMWVPNSAIVYMRPGDAINVRYDAFAYQKYGQFPARIESVSSIPASPQELSTYRNAPSPQEQHESLYKVVAIPADTHFHYEDKELQLSNGLRAQSTVFLEKRHLYEWMFVPFYNIKQSVMGPLHEH